MTKLSKIRLLLAVSACGLAVAAQAAITNPGWTQGPDGLQGGTLPETSLGSATVVVNDMNAANAAMFRFDNGNQPGAPPGGNDSTPFLQIQGSLGSPASPYSFVGQDITLAVGQTVSGYYALSGFGRTPTGDGLAGAGIAVNNFYIFNGSTEPNFGLSDSEFFRLAVVVLHGPFGR